MRLEFSSVAVIECIPKTIFPTEYSIVISSVRAEQLGVNISEVRDRSAGTWKHIATEPKLLKKNEADKFLGLFQLILPLINPSQ